MAFWQRRSHGKKKPLFWVPVREQDRTVSPIIDNGARRNLISQPEYEAIPQPPTRPPAGRLMGVAVTRQEITLVGWITLRFRIKRRRASQEFGLVKNLTIDIAEWSRI